MKAMKRGAVLLLYAMFSGLLGFAVMLGFAIELCAAGLDWLGWERKP